MTGQLAHRTQRERCRCCMPVVASRGRLSHLRLAYPV